MTHFILNLCITKIIALSSVLASAESASKVNDLLVNVEIDESLSRLKAPINVEEYNRLHDFLLKDYDKFKIPLDPALKTGTNVSVYLWPYDIMRVNEANSRIELSGWIDMMNSDSRLTWNPADFGGIDAIFLPSEKLWRPNIELFYSKDTETGPTNTCNECPVRVNHTGLVYRGYYFAYSFPCTFNVRYFPFDRQVCRMQLANWHMDDRMMDLYSASDTVNMSIFLSNEEWELMSMNVTRDSQFYVYGYFPVLEYTLNIKRKPFYYIVNLVVPSLMLTVTALVGYHMPSTGQGVHQEKVKMGLTTILSIYILQLGISDKLPRTSGTTPLLVVFYSILVGLLSSATVSTSLVILIEKQGIYGKPVPNWIRRWIPGFKNTITAPMLLAYHRNQGLGCRKNGECGCRLRKRCLRNESMHSPLLTERNSALMNGEIISPTESNIHTPIKVRLISNGPIDRVNVATSVLHENPTALNILADMARRIRHLTDDLRYEMEEKKKTIKLKAEWCKLADVFENISLIFYVIASVLTTLYFAAHGYDSHVTHT